MKRDRGQALVELSVLLPVLMLMCLGILDFARVFYFDVVAINAARSGARVAANSLRTDAQVIQAVKADAAPVAISDADIHISLPPPRTPGSEVTVTVDYSFSPITPFVGALFENGTLTVSRQATMEVY